MNVLRNCERSSRLVAAEPALADPARSANLSHGDVSERPKVLVSKTSVRESAPRVQIPPSPRGRGVLKTLQTETALGLFD
ncbi:MAG: hypothetical protein RLZZ345_991 [Actinomycetota bacterium]